MLQKNLVLYPVSCLVVVWTGLLFLASSLRHLLFHSNALDLGFFDQILYLLSQGLPPITTIQDLHWLGDHAAFIFYPIAFFYKLYPTVYWLFLIQALSLSLGAFPAYHLALQDQLSKAQSQAIAIVYLLYPLVFNLNLFDFHSEVIALPLFLWAILVARQKKLSAFILAILVILSCKAVLSLTVIFLGLWLWIWEKRRVYSLFALLSGTTWFFIATQWIIPHFSNKEVAAVGRYHFLGNSVLEIIQNLFLSPQIVLGHLFTTANLVYLILLVLPLAWGLSWKHLDPLVPALPALLLNLLTEHLPQKDLIHQYALPIFPFLLVAVISALAAQDSWLRRPRWIILWAMVVFLALAKVGYFGSLYLRSLNTWQASTLAIAKVETKGGVLTTANLAPHLSHRVLLKLAIDGAQNLDLAQFDYILLNQGHPGWIIADNLMPELLEKIRANPSFQVSLDQDGVILFKQSHIADRLESW